MIYCDGNTNIADDLVVYDRGIKERDKRFFVVLDVIYQKRVRVFDRGFQTPRNR